MRILLISPEQNKRRGFEEYPSGALLNLGTIARRKGHTVRCLHLELGGNVLRELCDFEPDVVGVSLTTFQVRSAREVVEVVRLWEGVAKRKVLVFAGGPHITATRETLPGLDAICLGEGETAWEEFLDHKPIGEIKNFNGGGYVHPDLDEIIPLPDLSLVNLEQFLGAYPLGPRPSMYILASRGCPFRCIFCQDHWGKKVRYRSPETVVREVRWLRDHGMREIFFQDDNFNLNRPWAEEILTRIVEGGLNDIAYKLVWRGNEKLVDRELLRLAKKAGTWLIFYGVESLSQEMLDGMKKDLTVEEIGRAVKLTQEEDIKVFASFILGLPGETRETIAETKSRLTKLSPDFYDCVPASPLPGTELTQIVKERGHLLSRGYDDHSYGKCLVRTDQLSARDIREELHGFHTKG